MKSLLLNPEQAAAKLDRLAYEIYENNIAESEIIFIGIADRGLDIAKILKKKLEKISNIQIKLITAHIDKESPVNSSLSESFSVEGKNLLIIDDVANSGKTILFVLKNFLAEIPSKIQIAVLIDRKHKRFPVSSDYIGMQISTTLQDNIIVEVEKGIIKQAFIE